MRNSRPFMASIPCNTVWETFTLLGFYCIGLRTVYWYGTGEFEVGCTSWPLHGPPGIEHGSSHLEDPYPTHCTTSTVDEGTSLSTSAPLIKYQIKIFCILLSSKFNTDAMLLTISLLTLSNFGFPCASSENITTLLLAFRLCCKFRVVFEMRPCTSFHCSDTENFSGLFAGRPEWISTYSTWKKDISTTNQNNIIIT